MVLYYFVKSVQENKQEVCFYDLLGCLPDKEIKSIAKAIKEMRASHYIKPKDKNLEYIMESSKENIESIWNSIIMVGSR